MASCNLRNFGPCFGQFREIQLFSRNLPDFVNYNQPLFDGSTLSMISFGVYFDVSLVPMWKIRNSGCFFKIGFKLSSMSVTVAPGNCLTFTNRFWESKLPSIPFNKESPAMQMVPSGHFLGVSLDGRLSSSVTEVTKIGVFQVVFQE